MSSAEWTLDQDSELNVLIPWLDGEPDATKREVLLEWLAGLLRNPERPKLMHANNVFSVQIPRSDIVVIWHLDVVNNAVQVSHIGTV